jgi:hypothetical protein
MLGLITDKDIDAAGVQVKEKQFDAKLIDMCQTESELMQYYSIHKSQLTDSDIKLFTNRKLQLTK